ncbi:MAG: BON domain-containing protein [Planctomycetota bacterium]
MSMATRVFCWALCVSTAGLIATFAAPHPAQAQFGGLGMGSNSGSTGQLGGGGSSAAGSGNTLSGSNMANSISSMNANRGMSAQNLRGFGGANAFRSAIGADNVGQQSGLSGLGGMNSGMMGMGGLGGMGGMGMGRMGAFGNMFGNQFGMNQGMNQQGGTSKLRIPTKIGFAASATPAVATARSQKFASRIPKIPSFKGVSGLSVQMAGETAVIRGTVQSEEQKELVERLAKLEPGISDVQNELEVVPPAEAASTSAATDGATEELPAPRLP